jgi:hypothetical protein
LLIALLSLLLYIKLTYHGNLKKCYTYKLISFKYSKPRLTTQNIIPILFAIVTNLFGNFLILGALITKFL